MNRGGWMKWSIHQLRKFSYTDFMFDETIVLDEIFEQKTDLLGLSPIHVAGKMDFSEKKIVFHFTISGVMTLPCSRTLNPVDYPFKILCTETFFTDASYMTDHEGQILKSDMVDLRPIVLENIILEIPMQIFSEAENDYKIAPDQGRDWSLLTEEEFEKIQKESQPSVDPRLAGLAKLLKKK